MKKKLLSVVAVAMIAVAAAWNVNENKNEITLSDLTLDNVEALAAREVGDGTFQDYAIRVPKPEGGYSCSGIGIIIC
ncbi:NVEALA domain-containing protein [Parabacteroides chinchillae]